MDYQFVKNLNSGHRRVSVSGLAFLCLGVGFIFGGVMLTNSLTAKETPVVVPQSPDESVKMSVTKDYVYASSSIRVGGCLVEVESAWGRKFKNNVEVERSLDQVIYQYLECQNAPVESRANAIYQWRREHADSVRDSHRRAVGLLKLGGAK